MGHGPRRCRCQCRRCHCPGGSWIISSASRMQMPRLQHRRTALFPTLMPRLSRRFSALLVAAAVQSTCVLWSLPARAASALAAWSLGSDGVLQLRTATGARLDAFFEAGEVGRGAQGLDRFPRRAGVDPCNLSGSGPVREVRVSQTQSGATRLVVEFQPGVQLDPGQLRLIGTSPDRWKLMLEGLADPGLRTIGEGDLNRAGSGQWGGGAPSPPRRP